MNVSIPCGTIIPLDQISEDDLRHLRPGAVFRWVVGYERSMTGTRRRVSRIVFRNLPTMTGEDWLEGEEWARTIAQSMADRGPSAPLRRERGP